MLDHYPKEIMTKDGIPVLIRPYTKEDRERLREFFSRISEDERWFIRDDIGDPEIMDKWIQDPDYSKTIPLIAVKHEEATIVGNVTLHMRLSECVSHVAHLRIIIDPEYRKRRLGTWMLIDAIKFAMDIGLEKLVAEFVEGVDDAAMGAAARLDFLEQDLLRGYLKDRQGRYRDLVIMVKNFHRDWSDF
jgi:RimJ/RimL family protein N-acetyltransferase